MGLGFENSDILQFEPKKKNNKTHKDERTEHKTPSQARHMYYKERKNRWCTIKRLEKWIVRKIISKTFRANTSGKLLHESFFFVRSFVRCCLFVFFFYFPQQKNAFYFQSSHARTIKTFAKGAEDSFTIRFMAGQHNIPSYCCRQRYIPETITGRWRRHTINTYGSARPYLQWSTWLVVSRWMHTTTHHNSLAYRSTRAISSSFYFLCNIYQFEHNRSW